jgi:hypothetical protein
MKSHASYNKKHSCGRETALARWKYEIEKVPHENNANWPVILADDKRWAVIIVQCSEWINGIWRIIQVVSNTLKCFVCFVDILNDYFLWIMLQ